MFKNGQRISEEDFIRDSERYITLDQIINLSYQEIEEFYDETSMGPISGQAE